MLKFLRVKIWLLLLPGSLLLLGAQTTNKAVDELWSDFLRITKKTDTEAIRAYFDKLKLQKPALSDSNRSYAITLVSKWLETANKRPEENASIALLCGRYWPEKDESLQYMAIFFYEWAYQISEKNQLYDLSTEALAEIISFPGLIDKALPYVIALEKTLDSTTIRPKLTHLSQKYHALAQYYYRLNKHDLAILYHKKVLAFLEDPFPVEHEMNIRNTIALSYKELGQFDTAIRCYDEVIAMALEVRNKDWEYIAKGNKGMVMLELGRLEEAETLLQEDFNGSLLNGQIGSSRNAAIVLARLKLKSKKLESARKYLEIADDISDTIGVLQKTILTWSDYFALAGDWEKAYKYRKRAHEMEDSVNQKATTLEFYRAREQHSLMQQKALMDQKLLEQQAARKTDKLRFFIVLSILALVLAALGLFFFLKQREQKIVQRHLRERLAENKIELERHVRRVQHHNELSQGIEEHLSRVLPDTDQDKIKGLLLQFTFSTEDDWEQFKRLFDEVHHDFIRRLHEQKSLSFTPGEIRLLVLLKLAFSNREIAQTLGISLEGVKKNKQRLRKKLQAATDTELTGLLNH